MTTNSPEPYPDPVKPPGFRPELPELPEHFIPSSPRGRLAAALAAFQAALPRIGKDETADTGSYTYSYADLASVSRAVLPVLAGHGLSFTAFPTVLDGKFVLHYRLLHTSGEAMEGVYPLAGGNAQAVGSAITYARRYALCAVTGVAPDDDDDAAAATQEATTQFPEQPSELANARETVRGAWSFHYGEFVQAEASAAYTKWSDGGALTSAQAPELRRFAAYLANKPKEDAGEEPPTPQDGDKLDGKRRMSTAQRGKLFALMGEIGLHDRGDQLAWINKLLKTSYESRTELTSEDAKTLIDGLLQGADVPPDPV
jgi:hypothetical protein